MSIFEFVKVQSQESTEKIFANIFACQAIFQSLMPLTKCILMKLLFVDGAIELTALKYCVEDHAYQQLDKCVDELLAFGIFEKIIDAVSYKISYNFQNSLRHAISTPSRPWESNSSIPFVCEKNLQKFSVDIWNGILMFIMNLNSAIVPNNTVKQQIEQMELMTKDINTRGSLLIITAIGYKFMLKDHRSQVWDCVSHLLREHLSSQHHDEALSLIFTLSYCTAGQGYAISALSVMQRQLMQHFVDVGIVYCPRSNPSIFYPTQTAIDMIFQDNSDNRPPPSSSSSSTRPHNNRAPGQATEANPTEFLSLTRKDDLLIIVETNLQVIAYTSSALHLAMLQMFVQVTLRFPNMVMGRITRHKAKQAFSVGISVSQIVDFLVSHAHPVTTSAGTVPLALALPQNVIDQLTLWRNENHRVKCELTHLINFAEMPFTREMFKHMLVYAQHLSDGAVLWHDEERMLMALTTTGFEHAQKFLRETTDIG